ncbi:MAG: hypothetical protein ACK5TR_03915 [Alphaproteobacteria bacterium]|nr:hypothetical protein [Alphaproteobacteria bacterium]
MLKLKFFRVSEEKHLQKAHALVNDEKPHCPKCPQSPMDVGYVPDVGQAPMPQRWFKGRAKAGLFGLSLINKEYLCVITCRCPRCGFLEQYAPYMFDGK